MKVIKTLILCILINSANLFAQENNEAEIRDIESQELSSLLKGDTMALFTKYWSPDMVVNTPANVTGDIENTKRGLRAGTINYSSMDRNIERIKFNNNLAIVMGNEVLYPGGTNENAGKKVTRRFTNVWMKTTDGWRLVARQATIIKVE